MEQDDKFSKLYEKIKKYIPDKKELKMIEDAFNYANECHKGLYRKSNDEYITHPIAVTEILLSLNVDYSTLVCSLLHETINHGTGSYEVIKDKFGEEIADIVQTLSKINKLSLTDDSESSSIYFRKILVGLAEDPRVLFIKLADRLHNMRTIWAISSEKQKDKANETLNVLIPIAHRLGMNSIKKELEDLCLKVLKPDVYQDIENNLIASQDELNEKLDLMMKSISEILEKNNIEFEIKGRVKSIHSIFEKLDKGKRFNDIYDILALRVLVEKESDCYLAIGLIHAKYRPLPKRFKDYIAMPKENMYQSLHTTVFGIEGYLFEVQVRTFEMNEIAEHGIASHWSYKEKGSKNIQQFMEQKLELFRNLIESNAENTSDTEVINTISTEFLEKMIYTFTPNGDIIELPAASTPIDFAYKIHSNVGDKTVGALVNDAIVPLNYELADGDIVKINTSNTGKPSKEWLKFVKTSQAKKKINAFYSKRDKDEYLKSGKESLEKELRKRKISFNDFMSKENLDLIFKELKVKDINDLYLSISSLHFTPTMVVNVMTKTSKTTKEELLVEKTTQYREKEINYKNDIIVKGVDDISVTLAKCCSPIKGDKIIGYVSKGKGIVVHKIDCINISDEKDRLIEVEWNEKTESYFHTNIFVESLTDKNILLDIFTKASQKDVFIDNVNTIYQNGYNNYVLTIKTKSIKDLDLFIADLMNIKTIKKIERTN